MNVRLKVYPKLLNDTVRCSLNICCRRGFMSSGVWLLIILLLVGGNGLVRPLYPRSRMKKLISRVRGEAPRYSVPRQPAQIWCFFGQVTPLHSSFPPSGTVLVRTVMGRSGFSPELMRSRNSFTTDNASGTGPVFVKSLLRLPQGPTQCLAVFPHEH